MLGASLDDDPAKVQRFVADKDIGWPQICDGKSDAGEIPKLYNVEGTPDLYVIDREGKIAVRLFSATQLDRQLAEVTAADHFPPRVPRDTWQRPVEIMEQLGVRPGSTVADVGARDGYFTFRLAARVGDRGKVFAQDLDEAALKKIAERAQRENIGQIETVGGTPDDLKSGGSSLDAIVADDAFHGFTHPDAMLAAFCHALRPGGRVAVLNRTNSENGERSGFPPGPLIAHAAAAGLRLVSFDADFSGPKSDRSYLVLLERPR